MVDLKSSRLVIRQFRDGQNPAQSDISVSVRSSRTFFSESKRSGESRVDPYLFVVDWEINESENEEVTQDWLTS
jgi:hypothetical protein